MPYFTTYETGTGKTQNSFQSLKNEPITNKIYI